jgi:hypothetical protein
LYIRSPELPITKGSLSQTVQSGRAGPGPDVYKRKFGVLGFSFSRPIQIQRRRVWRWRLPDSARGGGPAAPVAVDPRPRRAVAAVPRSGVEATVPRSRGRARASGGVPGTPRRRHFQGRRASDAPRCANSDGDTRGVRFERRHRRCEVHAATIAHDILRYGAVRVARMTTYICAYVVDDVLRWLPLRFVFSLRLLCFMHTTSIIYAKNCTILCLKRSSYISLLHAYFLHAHWKGNILIYVVRNYHKKSNHLYS